MSESPFDTTTPWLQNAYKLDRRLLKAISKLGFTYPTLVQAKCVPLALEGKDLMVRARTGSGKTLAFAIPAIQKILSNKDAYPGQTGVQCVILAPTKELIKQISKVLTDLTYYCRDVITMLTIADDQPNKKELKIAGTPDIILSTPAKLVPQLSRLSLASTHLVILDEADLILSYGYKEDIHKITSQMPKIFQGILLSATFSSELEKLKRVLLNKAVYVKLTEAQTISHLMQFYLDSTVEDKYLVLYVFLKLSILQGKGLIFVNDVSSCYKLKLFLQQFHIPCAVLNSELPLNNRVHIIEEFNRGVFDLLVATDASVEEEEEGSDAEDPEEDDAAGSEDDDEPTPDLQSKKSKKDHKGASSRGKGAAENEDDEYGVSRGIDFRGVAWVLNFDFPLSSSVYMHRIGRTARGVGEGGQANRGLALSFVLMPSSNAKFGSRERDRAEKEWGVLGEVQGAQPPLPPLLENDHVFAALHVAASMSKDVSAEGGGEEGGEQAALQPAPLVFNRAELESFRYRVSDVYRSITKTAVKDMRTSEIKRELLLSETLQTYFAEHPEDMKILRHDKSLSHPLPQRDHLKHLPAYLLPPSLKGQEQRTQGKHASRNRKKLLRKREERKLGGGGGDGSKSKDPLFNSSVLKAQDSGSDNEDVEGDDDHEDQGGEEGGMVGDADGMVSGRKRWKMLHKKGDFNPRNQTRKAHRTPGTFLKSRKY